MNFKRFHESRNLFDINSVTLGKWYTNSGTLQSQPYGAISAMQEVTAEKYTIKWYGFKTYSVSYIWFDSNKDFISRTHHGGSGGLSDMYTDTVPSNAVYFILQMSNGTDTSNPITIEQLETYRTMLNVGSAALPYEPYSSEVWHDTPHYIMGTSTDTITTLPADIYPTGTTATVGLKGQMEQNGTPTPSSPITPSETGDLTGNVMTSPSASTETKNDITCTCDGNGKITLHGTASASTQFTLTVPTFTIPVSVGRGGNGTFSMFNTFTSSSTVIVFYNGTTKVDYWSFSQVNRTSTSYSQMGGKQVTSMRLNIEAGATVNGQFSLMFTDDGQLPNNFEPYGYKIPISSAGQTTPVYLGEMETTRRIKKLVLTGNETFYRDRERTGSWRFYSSPLVSTSYNLSICSHFVYIGTSGVNDTDDIGFSIFNKSQFGCRCPKSIANTVNEFKAWLASQYAAGTPVCVWYVLATPETAVVNEPLRKIGNYADEVSGITIPTTAGANTISIGTTLQPSEATVNYHGWHPVQSAHEVENGQWD